MNGAARIGVAALACGLALGCGAEPIVVASKKFTESVILGEIAAATLRAQGIPAVHRRELGGTRILWNALRRGDVDVYPEYTGTIVREILAGRDVAAENRAALARALAAEGVAMSAPLGFRNDYALAVRSPLARSRGLGRISDLAAHPDLRVGFSNEFMSRADGWPGLRRRYGLPHRPAGIDHDLAYRALAAGRLDVTDAYTTDPQLAVHDVVLLADDGGWFTRYDAVLVFRDDLPARAAVALARLHGRIELERMRAMNRAVQVNGAGEAGIAAAFVREALGVEAAAPAAGSWGAELMLRTREHLALTGISLGAAILVAVPLGIAGARRPRLGQWLLAGAGLVQTIPALALLVVLVPLVGIGGPPAILALFVYSILPVLRNTCLGLTGIAASLLDSADAMGLPRTARLRYVELPLALPAILAGVKTSAVINVGTATLGALVGAGGYGQPILTGIRLDDTGLILQGAVPAAALALAVQGAFDLLERRLTPRGLRL